LEKKPPAGFVVDCAKLNKDPACNAGRRKPSQILEAIDRWSGSCSKPLHWQPAAAADLSG
jgi:hypothetical protein